MIRGSAPQDSKLLIDGFEVPLLYHTLGQRAIVPTEAIDKLDYLPGGFGVEYGYAASGIVALTTRAGDDHRSEQGEISVIDGGLVAQGGAGPDVRYMVAFRRSVIERLPLHHQLDVRVDRSWTWGSVLMTGFLDIQNAYLHSTVTNYAYSYDYSKRLAFTGLPIIPSIGLRGVL